MGADLRSAVSMSHLRELPPEVLDALLAGSTRMTVPAGSVTHWEGEPEPHLELVLAGAVQVVGSAQSGCQIAEDLLAGGRRVILATSPVGRAPARHRGRDTVEWLVECGAATTPRRRRPAPGVWYVGLRWLTHRASGNFLGFPADAAATADAVVTHLMVTVGGGR